MLPIVLEHRYKPHYSGRQPATTALGLIAAKPLVMHCRRRRDLRATSSFERQVYADRRTIRSMRIAAPGDLAGTARSGCRSGSPAAPASRHLATMTSMARPSRALRVAHAVRAGLVMPAARPCSIADVVWIVTSGEHPDRRQRSLRRTLLRRIVRDDERIAGCAFRTGASADQSNSPSYSRPHRVDHAHLAGRLPDVTQVQRAIVQIAAATSVACVRTGRESARRRACGDATGQAGQFQRVRACRAFVVLLACSLAITAHLRASGPANWSALRNRCRGHSAAIVAFLLLRHLYRASGCCDCPRWRTVRT